MKRFLESSAASATSDKTTSGSSQANKKKKSCQTFLLKYKEEWPCLTASRKGAEFAFCGVCRCDFSISHAGRDDCRRHIASKKHTDYLKLEKESRISNFFPSAKENNDLKTTKAEASLVDLIVKKNLPMAVADDITKFVTSSFPDSEIAKKFSCGRTKASAIANHLATGVKSNLIERMRNQPFTMSTDGSNDSDSKLFPIVIRSFDEDAGEVRSDVLSVPNCKEAATGKNIFELMNSELIAANIPWQNCLGLGSDNASVMSGHKNGVIAFIKEKHPSACLMGCVCHLIHIAAEKGANALPFCIDDKLVDIYYYLNKSSKRQTNLSKFQELNDVAQKKILKHVPTRWLSVGRCIDRLLENWESLRGFFEEEAQTTKTERTIALRSFLCSKSNRLYCLYLSHIITFFEKINTALQTDAPMIHRLHRMLVAFFRELVIQLVTPASISKVSSALDVDFTVRNNQRANDELMVGEGARQFLSMNKLKDEKIKEFNANVKLFIQTSCIYLKQKLPFADKTIKKAEVADPALNTTAKLSDLRYFFDQYPILAQHCTLGQLESEFALYQCADVSSLKADRVDQWWVKIGQIQDDLTQQPQFLNLSKFMLGILTLPHSSAHCERIFSMVRKNRTDFRASMQNKTMQSLMVLKSRPEGKLYTEDQLRAIKMSCSQALSQ